MHNTIKNDNEKKAITCKFFRSGAMCTSPDRNIDKTAVAMCWLYDSKVINECKSFIKGAN